MTSSERIEKYYNDVSILIDTKNSKKLSSEIDRLKTWMQKHQNESAKSKLMQIIEKIFKYSDSPELNDIMQSLISDYLALPEGKLATSKNKKKLLPLVHSSEIMAHDNPSKAEGRLQSGKKWLIADANNDGSFNLVDEHGEEFEHVPCQQVIKEIVQLRFQSEDYVEVLTNVDCEIYALVGKH